MSIAALLLIALSQAPQESAARPREDLRALAERVQQVHRGDSADLSIDGFRAGLKMEQLAAAEGEDRGEAELRVQFLSWKRESSRRGIPLIRYQLEGTTRPVVRGRDREGYWAVINEVTQSLTGRGYEDDLSAVRRDTKLARQMLRFVDPAGVLLGLTAPGPVRDEVLDLNRAGKIPVLTVTGTDAAFPLLHQGGEDARVRLKVYVEKSTGRLLAVEAVPLAENDEPREQDAEFVLLQAHAPRNGVLMPLRITHMIGPGGKRRPQLRIELTALDLLPGLKPDDFDRP